MARPTPPPAALPALVALAVPACRQAELDCPRRGPGRPPDIPDWLVAVLIFVALLCRKKTKSAQYRFLYVCGVRGEIFDDNVQHP